MYIAILVINPNSSPSVTAGIQQSLKAPPSTSLSFYTAPKDAPSAINDTTTGVLSAAACYTDLMAQGLIDQHDGFVVSCFSDHPLVGMLREATRKPVVGILEAAISHALLCGHRFGILTTGSGFRPERHAEVHRFFGSVTPKLAGIVMSGLGVVEIREGDQDKVEKQLKASSRELALQGADVIILGCAAMAGREQVVVDGVQEAGLGSIRVVDGNKAGVELIGVLVPMGIAGFGRAKPTKKPVDISRFDQTKRQPETTKSAPIAGPSKEPSKPAKDVAASEGGPSDEPEFEPSDDDSPDQPEFPITHEILLKDHTKVISALALDPSGARVVSGSHDYDCKLWDFGGMDYRCKPFKSWEPAGSYHIHDLRYSNDGQKFLVVSGTLQAKLYDRDGEEQATYIKGDPYIRDMKHTAGHVTELSSCMWHPKDTKTFITSSADSTIRIWDVENKRKQKTVIVVKSKERGARTKITSCAYSPDGGIIGGTCLDGAIHLWQSSSNFVRPNMSIEGAHVKNTETGSMVFSVDGKTLLTRGGDDTVKLWDLRSFKKALAVRDDLPTLYPNTNAIFSPDGKYVVTGAGATSKGGKGRIMFLNMNGLEDVKTLEVNSTPVKILWHSKINQIVTGLSSGEIVVLYSPFTSLNGAKLLANKAPAKRATMEDMSGAMLAPVIHNPVDDPLFSENDGIIKLHKRKREHGKMDPRKLRRPELPVTGPGRGGRVGASATQHMVQTLVRDNTRDEDPREALLKYADAQKDPKWTAAWSSTQPQPVFADVSKEVEEEEEEEE
ncbi:Transcriptional factor [Mycena kentingensis (nom. inval.)]|nr:Transcriptional factor [Mycena kentingensis (nom. inval.)]